MAVLAHRAPLAQCAPRLIGESNTGSWRPHAVLDHRVDRAAHRGYRPRRQAGTAREGAPVHGGDRPRNPACEAGQQRRSQRRRQQSTTCAYERHGNSLGLGRTVRRGWSGSSQRAASPGNRRLSRRQEGGRAGVRFGRTRQHRGHGGKRTGTGRREHGRRELGWWACPRGSPVGGPTSALYAVCSYLSQPLHPPSEEPDA